MKILLIHNQYRQAGGEDSVFRAESDLLTSYGHKVEHMLYKNSSIRTFLDKCLSGFRTVYNPTSAHALKIRVSNFNPDVIHIHNFLPLVSPSVFIMAKKLGVPVILTLHNYRLICPSATLFYNGRIYDSSIGNVFPFDAIWKGVYRNSRIETAIVAVMTAFHHYIGTWRNKIDCYIMLTQFAKEKFDNAAISIPHNKMVVKSNFVKDHGEGNIIREDFFLFVGRLTYEKGIETLLKAADLLNFKLVIIGDGPLRKIVENSIIKNSNVSYLGLQPKNRVISYLKSCKALIFPSIWYEGFPVTILEAFSTSTPVIASSLGGMKEIIQDKINGYLFEPGNENDLISKICRINEDREIARELSYNARRSYLELYTPSKNYTQLVGIYNKVIENELSFKMGQFKMAM